MKTIRITRDFRGKKLVSRITAIVIGVVGLIACIPFAYIVMFGAHEPYLSFGRFIAIILVTLGLPSFFYGIVAFLIAGKSGTRMVNTSTMDTDLARIRHAVETDRMTRK